MTLGAVQQDGATLRDHLVAAAQQGARPDPRLSLKVPAAGSALWQTYGELNACRPPSMGGVVCVPPSEIAAWQKLHGVRLSSWEVETLMAMDRAAVSAAHTKTGAQQ